MPRSTAGGTMLSRSQIVAIRQIMPSPNLSGIPVFVPSSAVVPSSVVVTSAVVPSSASTSSELGSSNGLSQAQLERIIYNKQIGLGMRDGRRWLDSQASFSQLLLR